MACAGGQVQGPGVLDESSLPRGRLAPAGDSYGFAAPHDNSLPLSVADYLAGPIGDFKGTDSMTINDRNIAALHGFIAAGL